MPHSTDTMQEAQIKSEAERTVLPREARLDGWKAH